MKDMVHKGGKTTRLLSALLAAVMILSSGGFEVLAADAETPSEWEAAIEEWEAAIEERESIEASEEAPEEKSDSTQGTAETPEGDSEGIPGTDETPEEDSDSTPGMDETSKEDSEYAPETDESPEEDSEETLEADDTFEEASGESTDADDGEVIDGGEDDSPNKLTVQVNAASGSYGNITWSIDSNGQLTVTGSGDFSESWSFARAPWYAERTSVRSAMIKVTGMTNALGMFYGCSNLERVNLSGFDTSNVTSMSYMFFGCENLAALDLSGFDTSNVTDMSYMFTNCNSLSTLDLSRFNTGKVTDMSNMFSGCGGLAGLNLNNFDTEEVTDMSSMFNSCSHLEYLDVSGFDTGKVTNMSAMFGSCLNLPSLNLSSFDMANVTVMAEYNQMFSGCYALATIYTPSNVKQSVSLPGFPDDVWYDPDGAQITELPQNLNYSISIAKNKLPTYMESEQKLLIYAPYDRSQTGQTLNILEWFADYGGITGYKIISYTEDPGFAGNVLSGTPTISNGILSYSTNAGTIDDFATITIELTCADRDNITLIVTIRLRDMGSDIANGSYKGITWVIDPKGKLTVTGRGDFALNANYGSAPWYKHRDSILSAEVNITSITKLSYMFVDCMNLSTVDVSGLDTSDVTDMRSMFRNCYSLKSADLSGFDTSNVTDMSEVFSLCSALECVDISSFNTAKVTNMRSMFAFCRNLSEIKMDVKGFVTAKVTDMAFMFNECNALKSLDVSGFDTANVIDMCGTFRECNVLESLDVSGFNTAKVTNMNGTFGGCGSLKSLDVSGFDTSNVTDMSWMFEKCAGLTSLNISGFDTSNVTNMDGLFSNCSGLDSLELSHFDTSNVGHMAYMFQGCESLTSLDVSSFDTSSVTEMYNMFYKCSSLKSLDLSNFDTSNVTTMSVMFAYCSELTSLDISSFRTSNVKEMGGMFERCNKVTYLDVSNFDTSNVTNMRLMFYECKELTGLDVSGFDTSKVANMQWMFGKCEELTELDVSGFDTSKVIDMSLMFYMCEKLTSLDVSGFDTSNVIDMTGMFAFCEDLTSLDVSNFDTSKVTNMSYYSPDAMHVGVFEWCRSLISLDVSSFDISNVTTIAHMFSGCKSLTSLDVSGFDTSNVINMGSMFSYCEELSSLDVSGFDTSNVIEMSSMFMDCRKLTSLDLSSFDTSNVEGMSFMFFGCFALTSLDLSSFDLSNMTSAFDSMLEAGENFTLIYTPRNLTLDINLPDGYGTGIWYKADGTPIKQLPKNLNYSIALQRDKAPSSSGTISVSKKKTVYACGEKLNIDDITVRFCGSDGIIKTVTDFTTNADEIDMSVPGRKILKVTYNGVTAEIVLSVNFVLTESMISVTLPDRTYIYSRQPVTPEPKVTATVNGSLITLSEGRDYRVSYSNNVNAGDGARIVITGQGYYSGTFTRTFTIDKAPLTIMASDIMLVAGDAMPDAGVFEYQVQGICRGDSLIRKPSFACDVVDMAKTGSYTITPHDADAGTNYEITYRVGTLTVVESGVYHTVCFDLLGRGDNITRRGIQAGSLLKEPPEPQDPETAGYAFAGWYQDKSFAANQKWNFAADTVQEDVTLYACWLNMAAENGSGTSLCIQDILTQTYTGSAIKPTVLVYDSDGITLLKAGKDYTISYHNNTDADAIKFGGSPIPKGGTGTLLDDGSVDLSAGFSESLAYVVIKGKGNYSGTVYQNFHIDRASVSDGDGTAPGITLKYSESLVYTDKKAQKPFRSIKYKKSMTAGKDYTITLSAEPGEAYSAKTADGAGVPLREKWQQTNDGSTLPTIPQGYFGTFKLTVEGIGNYSGIVEKTVFVAADKNRLMTNATITLGKNQKKRTNVTKEELEKGITLTPAYYDASNKMYYLLDERGDPTGDPIEKADDLFTVKSGSSCLKCGKDYVIAGYLNNQAVGTATMIIRGIGEYTGTKNISFKIAGAAFKNIAVEGLENKDYTGKAVIQNEVVLTNGKEKTDAEYKKFVYGNDYRITYKNNIKKGTATMTFTALPQSGYSGSFKKTFKIIAADLSRATAASATGAGESLRYGQDDYTFSGTVYYTKSGAKISDRVRLSSEDDPEMILKEGVDYSVSYANNKAATTRPDAVMTIKGKGNYQGTLTVRFPITAAPMSAANKNLTITAAAVFYNGQKEKYEPKVKVTDGNKTLSAGENKDYTVVEYKNTDKAAIEEYLRLMRAGTTVSDHKKPQAVIDGRNNYNGSYTLYLDVYETRISSSNLYIVVSNDSGQTTYNGSQLMPEVAVYYGENAKVQAARLAGERNDSTLTGTEYGLIRLAAGSDYTLLWGSNVTAGKNKGSVTVVGTGLYGGKVTGKFTILYKDIYSLN